MKKRELLDEILLIIRSVMEDKDKLEQIHTFLINNVYEEPPEIEIPEKYKKIVSEIAESIDAGLICYLNPETLEIEDIPQNMINDPYENKLMTGEPFDSLELKHTGWDNCIIFEPVPSYESFGIMEEFSINIEDIKLQKSLINALNRRKPFANFKTITDNK